MHAASHALQPMHVVVSMYLETVLAVRIPERLPRTEAEERRMSRFCTLTVVLLSCLIEPDEEGLELGRPRVWIHRRGRQQVGERSRMAGIAGETPVDRKADLPRLL